MNTPVFVLLRELLPIEATSHHEQDMMHYMYALLEQRGYTMHKIMVGDRLEGRFNVLAVHREPTVVLSTHLDTVPPHLDWSEDDDNFYGRGSCDAKGCAAAMIAAADRLRASDLPHALLFVVGEETLSDGAKACALQLTDTFAATKYIINGEPTDCRWVKGTLGTLALALDVEGKAAHSAYPERGHSATHDLVQLLHKWLGLTLPNDPQLGASYLNIGTIEGGAAANVVAARAAALVLARCTVPHEEVHKQLCSDVPKNVQIQLRSASDPQLLIVPEGVQDSVIVRFGTDVPFLSVLAPCLLYGPGSIHVAHSKGEFVAKKELLQAVDDYESAVRSLLKSAPT